MIKVDIMHSPEAELIETVPLVTYPNINSAPCGFLKTEDTVVYLVI